MKILRALTPQSGLNPMILAAISLVSFSGLMLEITITRIFSTIIWYHYAFVAVSVALFGWGLGGVLLHFVSRKLRARALEFSLVIVLIFSISLPVYIWAILQFPMSPSLLNIYYLVSTIPFFLGGFLMALLFDHFSQVANKVYFADLLGASIACLAAEPVLSLLGAESTVLMLGVTASAAGLLLSSAPRKRMLVAICLVGLMINSSVFLNNIQNSSISVRAAPNKSLYHWLTINPGLRIVDSKWNSFSRIDVVEGTLGEHELADIFIDADASTPVLKWNGSIEDAYYLKSTLEFLPYRLVTQPVTLIIGSGGGRDIIISLVGGSSKIVAVELNPIIVQVVRDYGENAGNVYDHEKVQTIVDEGRSFISRSTEKYDVIVLDLVDSWAAIAAGGYALAENYLYTSEAFGQFFDHLTNNGVLVLARWDDENPRLVSTAVKTLQERGKSVLEAGKHVAMILKQHPSGKFLSLFMLKKNPFTMVQAEEIQNRTLTLGPDYRPCYIPYLYASEPYSGLFSGTISVDQFYAFYPKKIEPVTDDNPYYFSTERPIPQTLSNLILFSSLIAVSFVAVPWSLGRYRSSKQHQTALTFVTYFSALGFAYILLEIALIQKFILFLGYPTRALSVILFSLLLSSGLGSFVSGSVGKSRPLRNIKLACIAIIALVAIYVFLLPPLFAALLPQDTLIRAIISAMLIFPLGFFMGVPFPTGIGILTNSRHSSIPWMWGVNGAMSVLGSVLATGIGMTWGFNYAMTIGAIAYLIAFLSSWHWQTKN